MDGCQGDVLDGSGTLFEVKSRLDNFEQADLRQVIVYAALSFLEGPARVTGVGLINPHKGLYVCATLDDIASDIAGISAREFFKNIVEFVTPVPPEP